MIYITVSEWLEGKFSSFNGSLDESDKLKMIEVNLDSGFPASLRIRRYYQILGAQRRRDRNGTFHSKY
jgi:hypothetical protein